MGNFLPPAGCSSRNQCLDLKMFVSLGSVWVIEVDNQQQRVQQ
jgi:hypothetical protein